MGKDNILPGDNTEKIWAHWFLAKPKTIAAGDLGVAVSTLGGPRRYPCRSEAAQFFFVFGFLYKTCSNNDCQGEYRIEIISNHSVVTLDNVILTFSTIISLSLQNR